MKAGTEFMEKLKVSVPHQLSRAEAKRRIDEGLEQLLRRSGALLGPVESQWREDILSFEMRPMGTTISGEVTVEDRVVYVEVALPWMLAALAGSVRQGIEKQGRLLLERR
jgi:hypothetical protein